MANHKPLVLSSLGRLQRLQPADLLDPIALGSGSPTATAYLRGDGTWDAAQSTNVASTLVLRDATGNFSAGVITATALVVEGSSTNAATVTTTTTTQTQLCSFNAANYGSGKFLIQATQGSLRQITELLVTHDGVIASATEYGTISTGVNLFSVDVSYSAGSVHVYVTSTSTSSTVYKSTFTLIGA